MMLEMRKKYPTGLGSMNKISSKPYECSNEIQKSQINHSSLVKTREDATKMLYFTKKTLDLLQKGVTRGRRCDKRRIRQIEVRQNEL